MTGKPQPGVLGHFAFRSWTTRSIGRTASRSPCLRGQRADDDDAASTLIRDVVSNALVAPVADAPFPAQVARDATALHRRPRRTPRAIDPFRGAQLRERQPPGVRRRPGPPAGAAGQRLPHGPRPVLRVPPDPPRGQPGAAPARTRQVTADQLPEFQLPDCIDAINKGVLIVQGFALDPDWLHVRMPREEAADVLGPSPAPGARREQLPEREGLAVEVIDVVGRPEGPARA